jgi:hypothetical protein
MQMSRETFLKIIKEHWQLSVVAAVWIGLIVLPLVSMTCENSIDSLKIKLNSQKMLEQAAIQTIMQGCDLTCREYTNLQDKEKCFDMYIRKFKNTKGGKF